MVAGESSSSSEESIHIWFLLALPAGESATYPGGAGAGAGAG